MSFSKDAYKIMNDKLKGEGIRVIRPFEEYTISDLKEIVEEYQKMKIDLIPPTVDEVCEEIEGWFGKEYPNCKVVYKNCGFYETHYNYPNELICCLKDNFVVWGDVDLPPHVIEMIAKFYKSAKTHQDEMREMNQEETDVFTAIREKGHKTTTFKKSGRKNR